MFRSAAFCLLHVAMYVSFEVDRAKFMCQSMGKVFTGHFMFCCRHGAACLLTPAHCSQLLSSQDSSVWVRTRHAWPWVVAQVVPGRPALRQQLLPFASEAGQPSRALEFPSLIRCEFFQVTHGRTWHRHRRHQREQWDQREQLERLEGHRHRRHQMEQHRHRQRRWQWRRRPRSLQQQWQWRSPPRPILQHRRL